MRDAAVLADAFARFEALGLRPLVGVSHASSVWGQPRQTHDIDVTLVLSTSQIDQLVESFESDFMLSRGEIEGALANRRWPSGFQLLHYDNTLKIDVFLSEGREYDRVAAERAQEVQTESGLKAWYVSAEDVVLMKLRWYELGNRVSDRQWNDLVQVIEIQGDAFDRDYLLHWAKHFGLEDLALEAFSEARP